MRVNPNQGANLFLARSIQSGNMNTTNYASWLVVGVARIQRHHGALRNAKGNLDPEQCSGLISFVKVDLAAMILDDLLCYRETESAASGLTVADKRFKSGTLNRRGDTGPVIPNTDLQASAISSRGDDDLSRVRRNRLTSIEYQVGNHPFETIVIEPTHRHPFMMMLDTDPAKLLSDTCHPNQPMNGFNNVPYGRSKRVTASGALQQRGEQLIHALNRRTNFLVEIVPLRLAYACLAEEFRICKDGAKRMAKIVGDEGDHPA
jgi:hypothetical protein